ncbi:hypothetical protein [Nocardia pseudovaccinii]|uniref:hypothetical protein n=1 Tax=Nocardia pseudovaccinii TaxID=189540 RepID=UPI0007A51BE0|nr:hypothetical protein [Nocardia pseudovaccinii]
MSYGASSTRRPRRTKAQVEELRTELYALVEAARPCSVRHVYYLGIGWLWDKDSGGSRRNYSVVVRELGLMRERGDLPWEWITDGTRRVQQEIAYDSIEDAMDHTAQHYRRNLWSTQTRRVEVWCESDSVAGVLEPVTSAWGVSLYSCRGQSSKTFVHEAVAEYTRHGKPVSVIFAGDFDPTGRAVPRSVVTRVNRYSGGDGLDLSFRQIAVTASDVSSGEFVTHDVNTRDVNYSRYRQECLSERIDPHNAVEIEALSPGLLRTRLSEAIESEVDDVRQWNIQSHTEQAERELLRSLQASVHDIVRNATDKSVIDNNDG